MFLIKMGWDRIVITNLEKRNAKGVKNKYLNILVIMDEQYDDETENERLGEDIDYEESNAKVKSPSMMTRYNNRPDLMATSLTEDGFFITNDLFSVDENGFYFFTGRADDMFKSGGNTVYPSKIEEILESHAEVQNAIVLGIEDDIKGKKPYAFVIRTTESVVSEQQLKDYVLANAAVYMHPRRIWFLETFPLIGSNKIDKKELLKLALAKLSISA
jgi:acyl-CoA synthetase (AMP-forming)/AMP-acid ligase II